MRDLGRVEPWQESLERSLARRSKLTRSSVEPGRRRVGRDLAHDDFVRKSATDWLLRSRVIADRSRTLVLGLGAIVTLALGAATLPSLFDGRGAQAAATAARADAFGATARTSYADPGRAAPGFGAVAVRGTGTCHPVVRSQGYVNPLAGATVTPERIDQGVDYAGSGTLAAIGAARVTYVAASGTGWPGAFIEYQLSSGPDGGCFVYYAEGVSAVSRLRVGETVRAGQAIARIIPGYSSGIEIGWGAGTATKTYAAKMGEWSATDDADSIATTAGKSFSALIAALAGPPGRVEG